jgi:hypothetical protein
MAIGSLKQFAPVAEGVFNAAERAVTRARAKARERHRRRIGLVLRPGPATPLWNELVASVLKAFRRRGEKARLARILGVSRQRLHLLLVAKTACPDAERTLQLMEWLQARREGRDPR